MVEVIVTFFMVIFGSFLLAFYLEKYTDYSRETIFLAMFIFATSLFNVMDNSSNTKDILEQLECVAEKE
jgi:hypothetical protein